MEGKYEISLTHRFQDTENILNGSLTIEGTGSEKKPYFMVNGILINEQEQFLLAGQIIRTRDGVKLIIGKSTGVDKYPRIIYALKRIGTQEYLSGKYNGNWANLRGDLVVSLDEYRTRALEILGSVPHGSFIHDASIELRKLGGLH